jgi:4Fe-4S ferredoxin
MVMKLLKTEDKDELLVQRVMYTKRYSLILNKKRCVGCDICKTVCPREAIEIRGRNETGGEELGQPTITIDENKCSFCGICNAICPFGAFTLAMNGERVIPVLEKESFPRLVREIEIDESRCPVDCKECEEACPFSLIKVSLDKAKSRVQVDIDKEHCPGCRLCEVKCPYDAIRVRRIFSGKIQVHNEKCPADCRDCVDVCPIPSVLCVSETGKVEVDESCCVYCGVCRVVCPVEEALELFRNSVYHTPVRSGAWNKALEKLTSTKDLTKELRTKLTIKTRDTVKRRFG